MSWVKTRGIWAAQKPIASVTDRSGDGKAAVDFDPQGARYVALRWTPEGPARADRAFEVAEINAFGDVPLAMLQLFEAPDVLVSNATDVAVPTRPLITPLAVIPAISFVSP